MNQNFILKKTSTLKKAMKQLDENGYGFLAIVDKDNKLFGIVTDGDIRRGFLNGTNELMDIINKSPKTMSEGSERQDVLYELKKIHQKYMPLITQSGTLVDIVMMDDESFNVKPNWVVIMAGGLGARLGELTSEMPKPMLTLAGKPIIERIIELFKASGFTKFMISVNYKSEIIKNYFKDGKKFGIEVIYIEEKNRLGTAGALGLIDKRLIKDIFFVVNGDVISSLDYVKMLTFHNDNNADATMCIKENSFKIPYGVIKVDENDNILDIQEKPVNSYYVNTGIYTCNPSILRFIKENSFTNMTELFKTLHDEEKIIKTFLLEGHWSDVGVPSQYYKADEHFSFIDNY